MASLLRTARNLFRGPSPPRLFPTTGFDIIDNSHQIQEETWEWYTPDEFYPVRIGQVFKSKYQVVGKLGYGAYSTVWLCRDLLTSTCGPQDWQSCGEVAALKHLKSIRTTHDGSLLVRNLLDEFVLTHHAKKYQAVVHPPLAITLREFRKMFPEKSLPVDLLRLVLKHVLLALDFLHTEAKMIQEKNILLGLNDSSSEDDLEKFERQEMESPSPRKIDGERIIYMPRPLVPRIYDYGRPVLCDFSEARFGDYNGMEDIQPYQYRAPEVILDIPWTEKVDIWNVGVLIWDVFENGNLFKTTGGIENEQDNIYHLAHMVALLGPPPKDFLERSQTDRPWRWFDKGGNWKGAAEIASTSWVNVERKLKGEDKTQFLRFVQKMLTWKPEERESARELLKDSWLNRVSS